MGHKFLDLAGDKMKPRTLHAALAGLLALALLPITASAVYPDRPVKLIVPFSPGGGTDIVGRLLSEKLSLVLRQPFIVENKPGAGAMIGAEFVSKAPADGYTLLMGTSAELTIGPKLTPGSLRYDPVNGFTPIAMVGSSANVILAYPGFDPKTIPELLTYAKANPDKVSYGSGGAGTGPHLSGELLKSMGKVPMMHIPYKGSGPALTDVIAGQTQLMISTMAPALPMIKAQKVRAIAVTSTKRSLLLPDTPTVAEQGLKGYDSVTWYAVLAPAGTPPETVERIQHALKFVLTTKDVADKMIALGIEPSDGTVTGKLLQERIQTDLARWEQLIKSSGIQAD